MKILLDAGHGGSDPGAVANGTREKDINLLIVVSLANLLRSSGFEVSFSHEADIYVSPGARLRMIKAMQPDAFVSVHCNAASNPEAHGIETIYRDEYDFELAVCVNNALAAEGLKDRGVKNDIEDLHRRLAVLGDLKVPACLCEVGFITNAGDLAVIKQTGRIAAALAKGIEAWSQGNS